MQVQFSSLLIVPTEVHVGVIVSLDMSSEANGAQPLFFLNPFIVEPNKFNSIKSKTIKLRRKTKTMLTIFV